MNRTLTTSLMLAILAGSSLVAAQNPQPSAGMPAAAPAPAVAATPAPPPRVATRTAMSDADARNCLEFPTNSEIIKCAEKYLQHKPKG